MEPKICPQCSLEHYNESNDFHEIEVCPHCGYIQNPHLNNTEKKSFQRSILAPAGAALFLAVFVMHASNWGQYIFSAIPLQIKTFTGMASAEDYSRLAKMCDALKKYDCVEEMLLEKVDAEPENIESWGELGVLQFQRRNFEGAVQSLDYYAEAGGKDLYTHYIYAKALSETGKVDLASAQYEKILSQKPHTIQVTVAKNYVDMLIKSGREKEAHRVVASVRRKGSNASDFMRTEMRQYASVK